MAFFIAGAALVVAGTGVQVAGSLMAQGAQKKATQAQAGMQQVQAARERYQQIRQARIARANIVQEGENQGAGGSSSVISGAAGVMNQAYGNIGYINDQAVTGKIVSRAKQDMINAQGIQTIGSGISSLGGSVFQNSKELNDIFK